MKRILLFLLILVTLISCNESGTTSVSLNGTEEALPPELKGLKIYNVSTSNLGKVKVGIIDNARTTSLTYNEGKITESFILVEKEGGRVIPIDEVISENDSIIVCNK